MRIELREVTRIAVLGIWATVLAVGTAAAWSQEASPPAAEVPGAADLASALAQNHPYMLGGSARAEVDQINRVLREAASQEKRAKSDGERRRAAAARNEAATKLLAILNNIPGTIRISLAEGKPTMQPSGPVGLPGDAGGLLLRIDAGAGQTRCTAASLNLSEPADESSVVSVNVAPTGTTWAVVTLTRMPIGRTTLVLELKPGGDRGVRLPLDVTTPKPGRLKVTILAADTNEPAPAMVRLTWKTNGTARPPANGLEFAPQFDTKGRPTGRREVNLPGRLGGAWWCSPGPFDMVLPPGDWEIGIRRGVEHVPVFDTFTVKSEETLEKTYKPRRWVDMRKLGWYSGDDHVHCQILSDPDAQRLMNWVQAEDIHLANVVQMGDIYRTYFQQRGFGKAYRVIRGDYILSPGQECPRTHEQIGHTLAMNITDLVRDTDRYFLYDWAFDAVHAQGGLTGYAHVCSNNFHVHRDMSINVPKKKVDFVELMQFALLGTELYYDFLNLGCKLTASAGSDVPWGGSVGEVRAYAYVGDKPFSADAWFDAFKRGRTFTTNGPMIELRVDDALPGDEIVVQASRKMHVKARVWGDTEAVTPTKLEIVRHGEAIRTAESPGGDKTELALEFEVDAGNGFWLAARAEASDGRKAHTTPVYVIREGLRFWKLDEVDALIAKRLDSLAEVEQIVAEATKLNEEGKLTGDRYRSQLAIEGPELLKRVEAAKRAYAELKEVAAKERGLRAGSR